VIHVHHLTGPLSLAVVSDCISNMVCALPLFFAIKAYKTADWRLVWTLLISQVRRCTKPGLWLDLAV
jgi:hypothetical protein